MASIMEMKRTGLTCKGCKHDQTKHFANNGHCLFVDEENKMCHCSFFR